MADPAVDALRQQLRERGYLTHGIERWFALDPWSSRAFWVELAVVALKVAVIAGLVGALAPLAIMLFRNGGGSAAEVAWLFAAYALAEGGFAFLVVVALALGLKLRPSIAIDTPLALLAISMVAAAVLLLPIGIWWSGFDAAPEARELIAAGFLGAFFFLAATIAISAAMLSFSIYELHRIPAIHRRPHWAAIVLAAVGVGSVLVATAFTREPSMATEPMITVRPSGKRLALIAVDGMTAEVFRSRSDIAAMLPFTAAVRPFSSLSAAERWASVGTGVRPELHGVRSIEGIRLAGSPRVLQRVSSRDVPLRDVAPALGAARREPLPPTARRRDYIWEVVAERGITAAAINWWATADGVAGGLAVAGPQAIFSRSGGDPLALDAAAAARTLELASERMPQLLALYLPGLDVVLNRRAGDRSAQLALSLRVLDGIRATVAAVRARGYDVMLVGLPGDGQSGAGVIATTFAVPRQATAWDAAPTVADLLGFPLSVEMPGRSLAGMPEQPRVVSYGARSFDGSAPAVNREYYESLKSLGYIQ